MTLIPEPREIRRLPRISGRERDQLRVAEHAWHGREIAETRYVDEEIASATLHHFLALGTEYAKRSGTRTSTCS